MAVEMTSQWPTTEAEMLGRKVSASSERVPQPRRRTVDGGPIHLIRGFREKKRWSPSPQGR
jgi:hypothetical protein